MIGTIRKSNISTRGGILAALLLVVSFASAQVACLTHTHCEGADCFEHREESGAPQYPGHHEHETDHECGHGADSPCEEERQDHDIHHHSHDGKTHPKRRFTAPAVEATFADATSEEAPVFELAEWSPVVDESPPFERYGLIFAERAPPLS